MAAAYGAGEELREAGMAAEMAMHRTSCRYLRVHVVLTRRGV